ncbi:PAS-domain containing protein [Roseibium sp.]|uniref:PAS-domain containing protein n=1 Tax=Roseibium sp. TaxID=1936156 RepID=UPI003A981944
MNHAFSDGEAGGFLSHDETVALSPSCLIGLEGVITTAMNVYCGDCGGLFHGDGAAVVPVLMAGEKAADWFADPAFLKSLQCAVDDLKRKDPALVLTLPGTGNDGAFAVVQSFFPDTGAGAPPGGHWVFALAFDASHAHGDLPKEELGQFTHIVRNGVEAGLAEMAAQRRLARSEAQAEHFEYFTELAGVGGWEIDPESQRVQWTEQTCRIHDAPAGYAPSLEEWFNMCDPAYRDSLQLAYREALKTGTGWKMDLRIRTTTGRNIWVSSVCQPVFEAEGRVRLVGSLMDVSAKRAGEQEIDRSQRLYRSTLNALSEAILVADKDGIVRWHNGAAETILECQTLYENMTHLGDIECFVQPADVPALGIPAGEDEYGDYSLLLGLLHAKQTRSVSLQVKVGAEKVRKWVKCRSEPLVSRDDGAFVGLVISVEDITQMKRNEDILNEAFEAIPNGFAVYDEDDRMVMANGAYRATYMAGKRISDAPETYSELLRRNLSSGRFEGLKEKSSVWDNWVDERVSDFLNGACSHIDLLDDNRWIQTSSRITPSSYRADYFADVTDIKNHGAILEAVFESYPGGVALFDGESKLTRLNGAMSVMLDIDEGFLNSAPTLSCMIARNARREGLDGELLKQAVARTVARFSQEKNVVYERKLKDGTVHEIKAIPMPDGGLLTILDDITIRKQYEDSLRDKERQARAKSEELELTFANMEQGISVFDGNGRLQFWNQKYVDVFRKPAGDVYSGVSIRELLEKEAARGDFEGDIDQHLADLRERLDGGEVVNSYFRLHTGRLICCTQAPLPGGGWIGTQVEADEDDPNYRVFQRRSQIDPLTGDANESWLLDDAEEVVSDLRLKGGAAALMVLSVGYVDEANALKGPLDDRATLIVAYRLRECIRPSDLLARLDDGRFAVLYRKVSEDQTALSSIASRVLDLLDAPLLLDGEKRDPGNYLGIVRLSAETESVAEVLSEAKACARTAMADGKSSFVLGSNI